MSYDHADMLRDLVNGFYTEEMLEMLRRAFTAHFIAGVNVTDFIGLSGDQGRNARTTLWRRLRDTALIEMAGGYKNMTAPRKAVQVWDQLMEYSEQTDIDDDSLPDDLRLRVLRYHFMCGGQGVPSVKTVQRALK